MVALWLMRPPQSDPYVSCSVSVRVGTLEEYLRKVNTDPKQVRISIYHVVAAAIARVYRDFPAARSSVVAGRIWRHDHVGVLMPVSLLESETTRTGEVGMMFLERAEQLSLRALAEQTRQSVASEKSGVSSHPFVRALLPIVERVPAALVHRMLDALAFAVGLPLVGPALHRRLPVTVFVTNPGSHFRAPEGMLVQGGAFSPPTGLVAVGSLLGMSAIQDMAIVEKDRIIARAMLPLVYAWDHRLFDGVMASQVLLRLSEILQDPESEFGPTAEAQGAPITP